MPSASVDVVTVVSFPARYAILLDGAFVNVKLKALLRRFPTAQDMVELCKSIQSHPDFAALQLLRTYFYHAPPITGKQVNPLDQKEYEFGQSAAFKDNERLLDRLELENDFALRLGQTKVHGWRLGSGALKSLEEKPREITAGDLVPNITQEGVDLRIGLDIARLSLTNSVQAIVVVSGDSDLVPAFKFARREGVRVYLDQLRHGVMRELKAHADIVLDVALTSARAKAAAMKPRIKPAPQPA